MQRLRRPSAESVAKVARTSGGPSVLQQLMQTEDSRRYLRVSMGKAPPWQCLKAPPWQCATSPAPTPPNGAPGGSRRLGPPRGLVGLLLFARRRSEL